MHYSREDSRLRIFYSLDWFDILTYIPLRQKKKGEEGGVGELVNEIKGGHRRRDNYQQMREKDEIN